MKDNLIHVCFILDESGSMHGSEADVIGGFNKTIDEQREIKDGECLVSYFKFSNDVTEVFVGKKLDEIKPLTKGTSSYLYTSNGFHCRMNADGTYTTDSSFEQWENDYIEFVDSSGSTLFDVIYSDYAGVTENGIVVQYGTIGFDNLISVIYNPRLEGIPFILESPYVNRNTKDEYAPYKYEIQVVMLHKNTLLLLQLHALVVHLGYLGKLFYRFS